MSIGLDDALLSWLVASAGNGLVRLLRGNPVRAALGRVVETAASAAVAEVAGHLDEDQAEHLRSSLLVRDATPTGAQSSVSTEPELRHAVHAWTAALDQNPFGGPGYLRGLGVDAQRLADALASQILAGIWRNARSGGVLNELAGWLWRDDTTARLDRIENRSTLGPPLQHSSAVGCQVAHPISPDGSRYSTNWPNECTRTIRPAS